MSANVIAVFDLGGCYVCRGEIWHSLDLLRAHLREFWPDATIEVKDADGPTKAYWKNSIHEGLVAVHS